MALKNNSMRVARTWSLRGLTLTAGILAVTGTAFGQTPFASFSLRTAPGAKPFQMINSNAATLSGTPLVGPQARFGTFSGTTGAVTLIQIPINFQFQIPNGYGSTSGDNIEALLTFSARVSSEGTGTGFAYKQTFQEISLTFTTLGSDPNFPNANLLTVTASNEPNGSGGGFIRQSSVSGVLGATESTDGDPDIVGFSSNFLNFAGSDLRSMNLNFNSIAPSLSGLGSYNASGTTTGPAYGVDGSNDYLRSFVTDGTGIFSTNTGGAVLFPEPGSVALMGIGVVFGGVILRRRVTRN